MAPIRRSLIAYFLVLMGVTLSTAGVFVHHVVRTALEGREDADAERLRSEADAQLREVTERFDKELLTEARTLTREFARTYAPAYDRMRLNLALLPLGMGLSNPAREVALAFQSRPAFEVRSHAFWSFERATADDASRRVYDPGDHFADAIFQVHLPRIFTTPKLIVRPPWLTNTGFDLPLDTDALDQEPAGRGDFTRLDDVEVAGHGTFRVVVLRAPLFGFQRGPRTAPPLGPPPPPSAERPPPSSDRPPRSGREESPGIYVQFARPRQELNALLRVHEETRDTALAALEVRTAADLARVWFTLAAVTTGLFLALPLGGWFIVSRSLRPLNTLTQAVSQVSERDFRLPVDVAHLSPELVPIHARLTHTLNALRRAFDREKQAVGDISHELRTPLAALQTTLDVTLRKPRDADHYRGTLEDCRDITKQLARLVDRILTLATLDAGDTPSRLPVNVSQVATECAAVIRPLAEGHNLVFTTDFDPKATTTTDPDKVREVMMNLLHNAVEYNRPGGEVRLIVRRQPDGVAIRVTDTGIGMTPEVQTKIFERFYRADPSRHATGVHAGLGLAIVKEYVERLNGRLTVTSQPDVGSQFEVVIPTVTL